MIGREILFLPYAIDKILGTELGTSHRQDHVKYTLNLTENKKFPRSKSLKKCTSI